MDSSPTLPITSQIAQLNALGASLTKAPIEQAINFTRFFHAPFRKQWEFHAAARLADLPAGPVSIGLGGARGPGKSHSALAQIALDDCCRQPELKVLFLRKVLKAARESFDDLRLKVLRYCPHEFRNGIVFFPNKSRILLGNFRTEADIDNYLGQEYDVIAVEEATQLTESKIKNLLTCLRTSKRAWRPRAYYTTNPGGVGHAWFKKMFIEPLRAGRETNTRFIQALVDDNPAINPEYVANLDALSGWLRSAWRFGDWDVFAGQFFSTWDYQSHTCDSFKLPASWAQRWAALDYGFTHPTVAYLFARHDGMTYVLDEFFQAKRLPSQNAEAIKAMLGRHDLSIDSLNYFCAGQDVFQNKGDAQGETIARQYLQHQIRLIPAVTDRINGAARILTLLGDPRNGVPAKVQIARKCVRLIATLPLCQHNPDRVEDVLKFDADEGGENGDDPYDAFRFGAMERPQPHAY